MRLQNSTLKSQLIKVDKLLQQVSKVYTFTAYIQAVYNNIINYIILHEFNY